MVACDRKLATVNRSQHTHLMKSSISASIKGHMALSGLLREIGIPFSSSASNRDRESSTFFKDLRRILNMRPRRFSFL